METTEIIPEREMQAGQQGAVGYSPTRASTGALGIF